MLDDAAALERAIVLATQAHLGQRYPAPIPEPYILHPLRVMAAVEGFGTKIAAVLHDALEDTSLTVADLQEADLRTEVIEAVVALTRERGQPYEEYIERLATNAMARAVKLADLADNRANNQRLPPTADVRARLARYERAIERLRAVPRWPRSSPP